MLSRKLRLFGLGAHTSTSQRLSEQNTTTDGQWVAEKAQGSAKLNHVEGDVYTGDDKQHGGCVEAWPDSTFAPGLFQRQ